MWKKGIDIFKSVQNLLNVFMSMCRLKSVDQVKLNMSLVITISWGVRAWHFGVVSYDMNMNDFEDCLCLFGGIPLSFAPFQGLAAIFKNSRFSFQELPALVVSD